MQSSNVTAEKQQVPIHSSAVILAVKKVNESMIHPMDKETSQRTRGKENQMQGK